MRGKKAVLLEGITAYQEDIDQLKVKRKETGSHITVSELPEEQRFSQLSTGAKHLVDTIRIVAYRAETAMVNSPREMMHDS